MKDLSLSIHMIGKVQSRDITLGPWFQNQSLEHHLVQDYMRTGHQDLAVPCLNHPQNTAPPQGPLRTWQPFKNVMFAVLRPTHSYFYNTSYPPKSSKLVPIKELYIYFFSTVSLEDTGMECACPRLACGFHQPQQLQWLNLVSRRDIHGNKLWDNVGPWWEVLLTMNNDCSEEAKELVTISAMNPWHRLESLLKN